jgi:hypothetical protein
MRFMMLVKGNSDYEAGKPPNPQLMATLHEMGERATKSGKMILSGGLAPSAQSTKVRLDRGRKSVIDGPFAEAKELVGGFAIFEVASKAEALQLAHEFVDAHLKAGITEFEMEIRPMFGPPG